MHIVMGCYWSCHGKTKSVLLFLCVVTTFSFDNSGVFKVYLKTSSFLVTRKQVGVASHIFVIFKSTMQINGLKNRPYCLI